MILDGIAAIIGALIEPIVMAAVYLVAGIANLFLIVVEFVVGLFVHGYKTKRIKAKNWKEKSSNLSGWGSLAVLAIIVLAIAVMEFMDKEVQLVASDGHSLPYAEVLITTDKEIRNERTDKTGKVEIPRFGLVSLSIIDPRYVEHTWLEGEIDRRLVVERTILGSGLDKVVNSLLKKDD